MTDRQIVDIYLYPRDPKTGAIKNAPVDPEDLKHLTPEQKIANYKIQALRLNVPQEVQDAKIKAFKDRQQSHI